MVNNRNNVIQDDFLEVEEVIGSEEPTHIELFEPIRQHLKSNNERFRMIHQPVQIDNQPMVEQSPVKRTIIKRIEWNRPSTSNADDIPPVLLREDFIESEPVHLNNSRKRRADEGIDFNEEELSSDIYYMDEHFDEGDAYIQQLMERASGSLMPNVDRKVVGNASFESILKRLSMRHDCDIRKMSCLVPMCGRIFESVQALAFHISYAHIDVSANSKKDTICLVCGITLVSSKAKVAHLSMKHRELASIHSQNCISQQDLIISPDAPMAKRLEYRRARMFKKKSVFQSYNDEQIVDEEILNNPIRKVTDYDDFVGENVSGKLKVARHNGKNEFSAEQMFDVVNTVAEYPKFVPWCKKADVKKISDRVLEADLIIGFPPLHEEYKSKVTSLYPYVVHSVCTEGRIFNFLDTTWRFGPGSQDKLQNTCTLYFSVSFEFKTAFYANFASMFFDQVVKQMVSAFLKRAERLYGPPAIDHFRIKPEIVEYTK